MKKQVRTLAVAVALAAASMPFQASASGIPTVDVAAIAQAVMDALQQAQEAADQLSAMQEEIEQSAKQFDEMKEMTTGNSGFGSKYYDASMYDYLPTSPTSGSWEQIYSSMDSSTLNSYRNKYGLKSDNETQQEVFDKQLTNLRTLEGAYKANNLRLENLKNLQALADSAQTPQEKEDIQARLQVEQANIANEANRLSTTKDLMERQDKMLAQKQNTEFDKFLSGE